MDYALNRPAADRRLGNKGCRPTSVRWFKEWVPQDLVSTGGKCYLFKWVTEDVLKALNENPRETEEERKLEPATEVLFLCSYEGCGRTFIDAGTLKKHANVHEEKQHVFQFEGCGKKFLDSSKLKRHYLIHTGERDFICPHEGCGKVFSLDFNLRAHMKTHLVENYHVCPNLECGKRYINKSKLRTHKKMHNDKVLEAIKMVINLSSNKRVDIELLDKRADIELLDKILQKFEDQEGNSNFDLSSSDVQDVYNNPEELNPDYSLAELPKLEAKDT